MTVLERSELEASPLADLHAIADQLGLDGFRRLRKGDLIDAILTHEGADAQEAGAPEPDEPRGRRAGARRRRNGSRSTARSRRSERSEAARADVEEQELDREDGTGDERPVAEGVVELLGNGSAFLRVHPPEPSDEDIYISAAQVRRCELVSGDRVSGPVRTPRRSERYPSLVRVETINGETAESVSDGARYEDLPVAYPSARLVLGAADQTLEAIEWLTPLGLGSRATIVGAARSGKTETARAILAAVAGRDDLAVSLVLLGVRPEEIAGANEGPIPPAAALTFAASADVQGQALERVVEEARRVAARGGDAVLLIDCLDGVHPHAARKALASARNLRDAGSLTIIATATRPLGGESTVIALDAALTSTGRRPILDLLGSGTLKPELLVGEDGARAIAQARLTALESAG
jgi:transcription termination factor Rho